jgi:hypothetical protein
MRMDSGFWSAKTIRTCRRHQIRYSITVRQTTPIQQTIAGIDEAAWVQIVSPDGGPAQVAQTRYQGDRLIVRRTRLTGAQAELFPNWRYHALATDPAGTTVELDHDHRHYAVVKLAIRDLKAGVGLRHCPSGKFTANAAWLVIATLAHNLPRWVAAIGLGTRQELVVAKTLRQTLLSLPGRITRSARRLVLCICPPAGRGRRGWSWPWRGCAASPTPREHHHRTAHAPTPDQGQRQPARTRPPAALALPIASKRLRTPARPSLCAPTTRFNRPRKTSNTPEIRSSVNPGLAFVVICQVSRAATAGGGRTQPRLASCRP